MKTILGTERTTTGLQEGDVIELSGRQWRVEMVNDCRALVRCLVATKRLVTPRFGKPFEAKTTEQLSISPNAEVKVISRGSVNTQTPKET